MGDRKGMTLIELMVAVLIFSVVVAAVVGVLVRSQRAKRDMELLTEAQQNARTAVDVLVADIRMVGYGIDRTNGQEGIAWAAPFDIVFNANLAPYPDTDPPSPPAAMDTSQTPNKVPAAGPVLYAPEVSYETGGETVRYTLDANNNGVIDDPDMNPHTHLDIPPTINPHDYALVKQVYGYDSTRASDRNGPDTLIVALCRGPVAADAYPVYPLFSYWLKADPEDTLWGDANDDGELSSGEITQLYSSPGMGRIPDYLESQITRVTVTVTAETRSPDQRGEYHQVKVTSGVNVLRNVLAMAASKTRNVSGYVFNDNNPCNGQFDRGFEDGIPGVTVTLGGTPQVSGPDGSFSFLASTSSYLLEEHNLPGWFSTTQDEYLVPADTVDYDTTFGDTTTALGYIRGWVYHDLSEDGAWQHLTEPPIRGVKITASSAVGTYEEFTVDSINTSYFFTLPLGVWTLVEHDSVGYYSTTTNVITIDVNVPNDTTDSINFGDNWGPIHVVTGTVWEDLDGDSMIGGGEPGIPGVFLCDIAKADGDTMGTTMSDAYGHYLMQVPDKGDTNTARERIPPGYRPTTPDSFDHPTTQGETTYVNFGNQQVGLQQLMVTSPVICIVTPDLKEGGPADPDLIVGYEDTSKTHEGSFLDVYLNIGEIYGYQDPAAIFDTIPTYQRYLPGHIRSLASDTLDGDADAIPDLVTGTTYWVEPDSGRDTTNYQVWHTEVGGNLPWNPTYLYHTYTDSTRPDSGTVTSIALHDVGYPDSALGSPEGLDIVLGTKIGVPNGYLGTPINLGDGSFDLDPRDHWADSLPGHIRCVGVGEFYDTGPPWGDMNYDGDVALGMNSSRVVVYPRTWDRPGSGSTWRYFLQNGTPHDPEHLGTGGAVNCMKVVDMMEDLEDDEDLVLGVERPDTSVIQIWHNNGGRFSFGTAGFPSQEIKIFVPDKPRVIPRSVQVADFDNDGFLDVVAGVEIDDPVNPGTGALYIYYGITQGYVSNAGHDQGVEDAVLDVKIADFNRNSRWDYVCGVKCADGSGGVWYHIR